MKHSTVEDGRRAWGILPWQLQTACTICKKQGTCHGKSRYKVMCLTCYIKTNVRAVVVRKLEKAGQL